MTDPSATPPTEPRTTPPADADAPVDASASPPAAVAAQPEEPRPSRAQRRAQWWRETKLDLKWATALLFVLVLAMSGFFWNAWRVPMTGEEDLDQITDAFFSQGAYVNGSAAPGRQGDAFAQPGLIVPFEVLSVLLLAALIAGVVIAMRDRQGDS